MYKTYCRTQVLFTFFVFVYTQWCTTHSVAGLKSYLPSLCLFTHRGVQHIVQEGSSLVYLLCVCLHIVVYNTYCRRAQVLFTFFVFIYTQWCTTHSEEGSSLISLLCVCLHIVSGVQHILQKGSSLVYFLCVYLHIVVYNTQLGGLKSYFPSLCLLTHSKWCTTHIVEGLKSFLPSLCLFTHSGVQHIVQEGSSLVYLLCVCLHIFQEGSSLVYLLCVCLHIVVYNTQCRRAQVLFTFFVFVYIQWCKTHIVGGLKSCLPSLCLFTHSKWCTRHSVGGLKSCLPSLCLFTHSGVQHILQEGSSLVYLLCVCLHIVVYNTYCRRAQVLLTFFVFVYTYCRRAQVLFTFCLFTHIIGGLKSCLPSLCLFTHSGVQHILQEGSSLVNLLCVCLHILQEGSSLVYLLCVCLHILQEGSSLVYLLSVCLHIVVYNTYCRRAQVLFTFFVFAYTQWCTTHIVGLKSCLPSLCLFTHSGVQHILQEGSSLIYHLCVCLHIVVYNTYCRTQVLFTFLCLFTHSGVQHILQEGSSLIYLLCVCLHILQEGSSLVYLLFVYTYCRRVQVLFTFFVFFYTQ